MFWITVVHRCDSKHAKTSHALIFLNLKKVMQRSPLKKTTNNNHPHFAAQIFPYISIEETTLLVVLKCSYWFYGFTDHWDEVSNCVYPCSTWCMHVFPVSLKECYMCSLIISTQREVRWLWKFQGWSSAMWAPREHHRTTVKVDSCQSNMRFVYNTVYTYTHIHTYCPSSI